MLASSAHLTRTAQHNNPVENFQSADIVENLIIPHLKISQSKFLENGETEQMKEFIV